MGWRAIAGVRAPDETLRGGIGDRSAVEIKLQMMGLDDGGEEGHKHIVERTGPILSELRTRISEKQLSQGNFTIPL